MKNNKLKISVIGVGYVGLPIAVEFSKYFEVIGYDRNKLRVDSLSKGIDLNHDISKKNILSRKKLFFTSKSLYLNNTDVFIITLPTPIKKNKTPDLSYLKNGCKLVSNYLKKNTTIVFESTVYPGLTEEFCLPEILKHTNLTYNKDFYIGYSPERINPGDKKYRLQNIDKLVAGSNLKTTNFIHKLYKKIIKKNVHKVNSIKIAEAAKVIENCQRDLNIAFINELYLIFNKLNLNTNEILAAANTKWNFLNFKPGLVGGHCIGVDPYYLTYIAKRNNYNPKVILSGREINDKMSTHIVNLFLRKLSKKTKIKKANLLIMGVTFKENCPDIRNSKIIDVYKKLKTKVNKVDVYDPIANNDEVYKEFKIKLKETILNSKYDGILVLVDHLHFSKLGIVKLKKITNNNGPIFDFKNIFKTKNQFIN